MPEKSVTKRSRPTADIPAMPEDLSSPSMPPSESVVVVAAELVPAPEAAPPTLRAAETEYGLFTGEGSVTEAVQKFIKKLGDYLSKALDDASSLEVRTYVSEDIGAVTYDKGEFSGNVRLRAITRVNIAGDSLVCVPETDGELDTAVWAIHMDMLRQAQGSRAELMKTMVSAAGSLGNILSPKA
jgi:hypothetical protein